MAVKYSVASTILPDVVVGDGIKSRVCCKLTTKSQCKLDSLVYPRLSRLKNFVSCSAKSSQTELKHEIRREEKSNSTSKRQTLEASEATSTSACIAMFTQNLTPGMWIGGATAGMFLLAAGLVFVSKKKGSHRPVDSLARRGLVYTDRHEDFQIIRDFDSPTEVNRYSVGNSELREAQTLMPLSEEKRRLHREARMAEHGWKKREVVLVEGDPVPEGVDEKAVRYIPRKHPFALSQWEAKEEWSEEVVRRRLRQRRGRPEKDKMEANERLRRYRTESEARERKVPGKRKGSGEGGEGSEPSGWRPEHLPPTSEDRRGTSTS